MVPYEKENSSIEKNLEELFNNLDEMYLDVDQNLLDQNRQPTPCKVVQFITIVTSPPKKRAKKWGPVQPTRMSQRIPQDGKSILDRVKEIKEAKMIGKPSKGTLKKFLFFLL